MTTWLITGCSSGLGRALALEVLARGHNAVITSRNAGSLRDIADRHPGTALPLDLDVTDPGRVNEVVRIAQEHFGGIDVLVNNAGYGYRSAVEEGVEADVAALFATNFQGPVSAIKAVLPQMRSRRRGSIVNISSTGTRITPAGSGYYAASKAALEAVSASLAKEVAPLGISVTVVQPGQFRTDFAGRSLTQSPAPIADYADTAGRRRIENDTVHGTQQGDPAKAAVAVIAAVEASASPLLLLLGSDAVEQFHATTDAERAEVAQWQHVSAGTDFGA